MVPMRDTYYLCIVITQPSVLRPNNPYLSSSHTDISHLYVSPADDGRLCACCCCLLVAEVGLDTADVGRDGSRCVERPGDDLPVRCELGGIPASPPHPCLAL
mmetsp:Transcript_13956/g.33222  ORF Transcript_13956/g.33222 Transcript_13956/m.33222 type:complete len:102 (-) Transcript_13956:699-1004(-)